jgi:phospho-N-acetylmuramoyl-pentapeptide-transferase
MKYGQAVRTDGPQTHLKNHGTPTMGGALILISIGVSTLLWCDWSNRFIWPVLVVTLGFGAMGWVDDYRKVVYQDPEGMRSPKNTSGSRWSVSAPRCTWPSRCLPQLPAKVLKLFWTGCSRAFDGPAAKGRPDRAVLQDHQLSAGRLGLHRADLFRHRRHQQRRQLHRRPGRPGHHADRDGRLGARPVRLPDRQRNLFEIPVHSAHSRRGRTDHLLRRDGGGGLAFLWYNTHPAQVFMGDVGALALGGALGTIAVIVRQEIVLFIMGGIFVAETLSVIIQVGWFKYTKKRYGTGPPRIPDGAAAPPL